MLELLAAIKCRASLLDRIPSQAFSEVVQLPGVQPECGYLRLQHWASGQLVRLRVRAGQFLTSAPGRSCDNMGKDISGVVHHSSEVVMSVLCTDAS